MALDRSGLIARTYLLPQQQSVAPQQAASPFNDQIQALEGIQHVQGVTEDYYRKVQALKAFMQDAQTNLGIDVRVPDLSRPESIKLNQVFRDALSDILAQGNLLKTSQGLLSQRDIRGVQYAVPPSEMPAALMTQGREYFERPLSPDVVEVNNLTQQPSYDDQSYKQKLDVYNQSVERYKNIAAQDPERRAWAEYQIAGLTPPARAIKQWAPRDTYQDRAARRRADNAGLMLRKIINTKRGFAEGFQASTKTAPSGELFMVNYDWANIPYGQSGKTIAYTRIDPKTKKADLVFTDGTIQDLTKVDPATVAAQLGQRFGYTGADLQEYIIKNDLEKELGAVKEEWAIPEEKERKRIEASQEEQRKYKATLIGPIRSAIKSEAESLDAPWFFGTTSKDIDIGGGRKLTIGVHKDGKTYTLENAREFFPLSAFADKKGKIDTGKAQQFYNKFTEQKLSTLLTNLLNNMPIDDFGVIYEALGLSLPEGGAVAPAVTEAQPAAPTGETEGQRRLREYRERLRGQ